jgi:hypothetical protein
MIEALRIPDSTRQSRQRNNHLLTHCKYLTTVCNSQACTCSMRGNCISFHCKSTLSTEIWYETCMQFKVFSFYFLSLLFIFIFYCYQKHLAWVFPLEQTQQTTAPHLFFINKVLREHSCANLVTYCPCDCFCSTTAELNSSNRDPQRQNLTYLWLTFIKKCLTPALEQ